MLLFSANKGSAPPRDLHQCELRGPVGCWFLFELRSKILQTRCKGLKYRMQDIININLLLQVDVRCTLALQQGKLICTSSTHYICYFKEQLLRPLFSTSHGRAQCGLIGFYESEVQCGVRGKWLATLGLGCTKHRGRGLYPRHVTLYYRRHHVHAFYKQYLEQNPRFERISTNQLFSNFPFWILKEEKHAWPHPRVSWQWPNYVTKQRGLRSSY